MNQRTVSLLLGTSLLSLAIASTAFAQDAPTTNTGSIPAPIPPRREIGNETRTIQLQKRTDIATMRASTTGQIKAVRADAREAINNDRGQVRTAVAGARADGTTTQEERMGLRETREQVRGDIKDIRKGVVASSTALRMKLREDVEDRRDEAKGDIMKAVMQRNMRLASTTERMRMASTTLRDKMGSSTEEAEARRAAKAVEQAAKFAQQALDRMGAAIDRLNTIAGRLESRINKVSSAGGDVTAAKAALTDAQSKISSAKDGISTVSSTFAEVATLANPKDGASKVETAMKNQQMLMRAAQDALMKVVTALTGQQGADAPATVVSEPVQPAPTNTNAE